jgi:hypothetical protein
VGWDEQQPKQWPGRVPHARTGHQRRTTTTTKKGVRGEEVAHGKQWVGPYQTGPPPPDPPKNFTVHAKHDKTHTQAKRVGPNRPSGVVWRRGQQRHTLHTHPEKTMDCSRTSAVAKAAGTDTARFSSWSPWLTFQYCTGIKQSDRRGGGGEGENKRKYRGPSQQGTPNHPHHKKKPTTTGRPAPLPPPGPTMHLHFHIASEDFSEGGTTDLGGGGVGAGGGQGHDGSEGDELEHR